MIPVDFHIEPNLSVAEFVGILCRSTLAERETLADTEMIAGMLAQTSLIVTARVEGKLVGVCRAMTDFHFSTYLSDLAVDVEFQGQGIGRELVRLTHEAAGEQTTLTLLADQKAETFYPHIGMAKHKSCWVIPQLEPV